MAKKEGGTGRVPRRALAQVGLPPAKAPTASRSLASGLTSHLLSLIVAHSPPYAARRPTLGFLDSAGSDG